MPKELLFKNFNDFSADQWLNARALRNKIAHAYDPKDLVAIYNMIILTTKMIAQDYAKTQAFIKTVK